MLGYMQVGGGPTTGLIDRIELGRRILDEFGVAETGETVACIRRYLALMEDYGQ